MAARIVPIIEKYDADNHRATARFDGHTRELGAYLFGDLDRPRLRVCGFAAQYVTGAKLWYADVIFYDRQGVWRFDETVVRDYPQNRSNEPPRIVGFIDDVAADEVGIPNDEYRADQIRDRAFERKFGRRGF